MKSEKTLIAYTSDLHIFLRFLKKELGGVPKDTPLELIEIETITLADVKSMTRLIGLKFLNYIATERHNNARSRKRKLAALKTFYKCLSKDLGLIDDNPVKDLDYPKLPASVPKFLSLEESRALLSGLDPDDPYYLRDFCIVTLFINCGMRLSELTDLNLTSVNLDARTLRLVGKGNKERVIHINDACAFAIADYLTVRQPTESMPESIKDPNALFLSKQKRRITGRRVEQIVDRALAAVHLDGRNLSVHKLRHTAATLMYQHGGADALTLKEILGHKSVATTEIYTHIAPERMADIMDNNPLANQRSEARRRKTEI
jgi:site-specific recombinase XerD